MADREVIVAEVVSLQIPKYPPLSQELKRIRKIEEREQAKESLGAKRRKGKEVWGKNRRQESRAGLELHPCRPKIWVPTVKLASPY